jgi:hypothetical protein
MKYCKSHQVCTIRGINQVCSNKRKCFEIDDIDKKWIFEILDKTNAFAKQLIEDHFNRHK